MTQVILSAGFFGSAVAANFAAGLSGSETVDLGPTEAVFQAEGSYSFAVEKPAPKEWLCQAALFAPRDVLVERVRVRLK